MPAFLRDFLNKPQALNHFQTMNRYWMEDTYGKYGVQLDAYGPYRLPGRSYQYFHDYTGSGHCPDAAHYPCTLNFRTDAKAAWTADVGAAVVASYDNIFYVSAGEDQSSTWQEFGEMKFTDQNSVPDAFGPKAFDPTQTNWAPTRYVPWTSWASASSIWPNAQGNTSIEAESSGMSTYAHELTHNLGIGDNYGNPYGTTQQRGFTGMWDMMSRGTFNGAGGPHTRFEIPPTQGAALGSQHNVRNKLKLGFVTPNQVLRLNRSALAGDGIVVADVKAREVDPGSELAGVQVALDGSGDNDAPCVVAQDWRCDGITKNATTGAISGKYNYYFAEVVQQVGSDSFDPGHGVLFTKTKTSESQSCGAGVACFVWIIDSHPDDINHVDFVKPDGTPKHGDARRRAPAQRRVVQRGHELGLLVRVRGHARTACTSTSSTSPRTPTASCTTSSASSRSTAPARRRAASRSATPPGVGTDGDYSTCTFPLTNTGTAAAIDPSTNPTDVTPYVQATSTACRPRPRAPAGARSCATRWPRRSSARPSRSRCTSPRARARGSVTLTATSVSDPSKTAEVTCGRPTTSAAASTRRCH